MFLEKKEKTPQDPSGSPPDGAVLGLQSPGLHYTTHELPLLGYETLKGKPGQGCGENLTDLLIGPENRPRSDNTYKRGYGKTTEAEILLEPSHQSSIARVYACFLPKLPEGCGSEVGVRMIFPAARQSYLPWVEMQAFTSADQKEIGLLVLHPKEQDHCGRGESRKLGQGGLMDCKGSLQTGKKMGECGRLKICS